MNIEPKTLSKKHKIIALSLATALIIVGGAIYYLLGEKSTSDHGPVAVTQIDGLPEGASVEVVDSVNEQLFNTTPRPALERPLPRGGATEEVYALMVKHRAEAVAMLRENPALMTQWLGLGAAHKQAGDYEGARIYFTYVATVNPGNLSAHLNLGNLYAYYLKDAKAAEVSYMKAISVDPTYVSAYGELYLARMAQGKTKEAVSALTEGLAKNPKALDLAVALAHHYRDQHDVVKAKEAYAAAIKLAKEEKNTSLEAALTAEMSAVH